MSTPGCNCGYGGYHEPENERCELFDPALTLAAQTADDAGVAPEQAAVARAAAARAIAHVDHDLGSQVSLGTFHQRAADAVLAALAELGDPKCEHGIGLTDLCMFADHVANDEDTAANLPADDGARAAIKAEALREAADEFVRGCPVNPDYATWSMTRVAKWLRDRADNLAADQHADEAGL